jgi:hypothetical protein
MPECDFHQLVNDPDLWHPTKGTKRVMQGSARCPKPCRLGSRR